VFGQALGQLRDQGMVFELILPTMPHLQNAVTEGLKDWPVQPRVVVGEQEKRAAFRIAHAALAKSGTVTLELALAGIPSVAAYRVPTERRGRYEIGPLRASVVLSTFESPVPARPCSGENNFTRLNPACNKAARAL